MKVFSDLFNEEYNTQREQWENTLKSELKLDDIASKTSKKHLDLGNWPTLSLKSNVSQQLPTTTEWKKASQTYVRVEASSIQASLELDLDSGVRVFFFHHDELYQKTWDLIQATLEKFPLAHEVEVCFLGEPKITIQSKLKIINGIVSAKDIHEQGGHNVHELAVLTLNLIESKNPTHLGVYMDSHFFKNVAKVRAAKLLASKVFKEMARKESVQVVTLNSYREWTLFERYSNILRNNVQVASGLISGADIIQSSGYEVVFDLETETNDKDHDERSLRMARNTSHILSLESMLGIVGDAAYGSYHLENLSHEYAQAAWKLMQLLFPLNPSERKKFLEVEIAKICSLRLERVKTRKDVLTGMNDFPDGKEHLNLKLKPSKFFRVSRGFEELRLKVEGLKKKPVVEILLQGDYGSLNARVNFIKNYFELIGLEVLDPLHNQKITTPKVMVLCAKDEDYADLAEKHRSENCLDKFLAGKVEVDGFKAIHAGQNIFDILTQLVSTLEKAQ